jgi:glycosyltransferase involved in cell wall biosynthesis
VTFIQENQVTPNISVIVPLYNRFSLLKPVVESILAQTLPVTEIIIIDDGSTEHTPATVERHIRKTPAWRERVRYYYQQNQGQSVANNVGIGMAKGEWLAFNAHDDVWLPQKLEWQFRALEKSGREYGLCFTDAWFVNNPHMKMTLFQHYGKDFTTTLGTVPEPARLIVSESVVWLQTVIARADLVHRVGGLDPKLRYCEDHDFLFRMALVTKFCYVGMPMVLIDRSPAEVRHIGEGRNWHKEEYCLQMGQYRFEKQLNLAQDLPVDVRKAIRKNLRSIHSAWTNWYLANAQYEKARESVSVAARYDLTPNIALKWLLTRGAPKLATKILSMRDRNAVRYDRVSWQLDEQHPSMTKKPEIENDEIQQQKSLHQPQS